MGKIDDLKLRVLREKIVSLSHCTAELCDIRPDIYEINRGEWKNKLDYAKEQIGAKQMLMFIGPFSSGKSSFINALLGEDILPTNNRPCTSVVTELKFIDGGGHSGFAVRKDGQESDTEYDFGNLLRMVDGPTGAIGESAAYHHIELRYDISQSESQCLRQLYEAEVTIVDCPGYGSPYYSNDEIIEEYISKASHTFWINPVDRMGSVSDYKKLSDVRKKTTMLIPIMSKADLIDSESKMESIRDDYTETIGTLFRSKEPIFCSAIKYRKAMEIAKSLTKKNALTEEERNKTYEEMERLFRESGLSNVFAAVIDSSSEKSVASSKVISVFHDIVEVITEVKKTAERELSHWRRELRAKGWDDSRNQGLEDARDLVSHWIEGESERIGKQLDSEIRDAIQGYMDANSKRTNINADELQRVVTGIWEDKIQKNSRIWSERIKGEYKDKWCLSISPEDKTFILPTSLTEKDPTQSMRDARDVVLDSMREAGMSTTVQGGIGAMLMTTSFSVSAGWFTAGLAAACGIVGGALVAVAAIGVIPVYTKYSKLKKDENRRQREKLINSWLETLHMRDVILKLLSDQNETLFSRLEKEQQRVAGELIDNKDRCESILRRISEMEECLKTQFVSIKNGGLK